MVKSMTGFGRAEDVTKDHRIAVELKSVNHRYLDLSIKMPKKLSSFDGEVRTFLKQYMQRGKVDVYITYEDYTAGNASLKYNRELAAGYLKYLRQMSSDFGLDDDIRLSALARFPDVFTMEEADLDEDALWESLQKPLTEACRKFVESRTLEGGRLKDDLLLKLDGLGSLVAQVVERSPLVVEAYRQKIEAKVGELLQDTQMEESRIAAEVILFADKICNDEETVRLQSHIHHMIKILDEPDSAGRKLDFIAQEMNREANTILSKSNDLTVSNLAIEIKTEIEKIREQIQNIE